MEVLHNNTVTELTGKSSEELRAYYEANPWKYYQAYVAGSISPYYDAKLACIGASEEFCELSSVMGDDDATFSEAGDYLFQLVNVANFYNIDLTAINLTKFIDNVDYSIRYIAYPFGEVLGTIMKKARYSDPSYFVQRYGMSLEERIKIKLINTIEALQGYVACYNFSLKDIMDYNLEKLDKRHSADGKYSFGCGYGATLVNGGRR